MSFRAAADHHLRVLLLRIVWRHHQPPVSPLLAEALLDPEPRVWQKAIDGLSHLPCLHHLRH